MKVGILGGSFNPVHNGHLLLADAVLSKFLLDQIWFMPAYRSNLKNKQENYDDSAVRLQMLEAALKEKQENRYKVSDMELKRKGNTYTYDTYLELKRSFPQDEFLFVYGADCLLSIEKWYNSDFLLQNLSFLFVMREGVDAEELKQKADYYREIYHSSIRLLDARLPMISSTDIRNKLLRQEDISGHVPESVCRIIKNLRLYENEKC